MSRVKKLGRRRALAVATGISVVLSLAAGSPAEAKKKKPKCSITGTEGIDEILIFNFFTAPAASSSYFYSEEPETVCALGGDDFVGVFYEHTGLTKVSLGSGNDAACVGGNDSQESVDGGKGADAADPDLSDGDSVQSVESDSVSCF